MEKQEVLEKLKEWANQTSSVQALILTSSRVDFSNAQVDQFSDYDVAVYVDSLDNFRNDDWLSFFGNVLVKWSEKLRTTFSEDWLTRLVIFEDRLRIDFQITSKLDIPPSDYDLGYQILVDKDGIAIKFPQATKTGHLIKKPSEEEFLVLVNEFFWDATYVPKYLWRGNLFFAKFMLDSALRFEYLEKMIEWYIASQHEWNVNTGLHGKYFEKYLDQKTWEEVKKTFVGADIEENWQAFYKLVELFNRFSRYVANDLEYNYPEEQEEKMLTYYRQSKDLK